MKLKSLFAFAATAALLGFAGPASAQGNLTVYCGVQEEWCQLVVNEFQKQTGISVAMTRKSAGEVFAQVKAEAENPQGDIWWGGTGDPHLQAADEDLTLAYDSPNMTQLRDWAIQQHKTANGKTVGIYLGALGFGYNKDLLASSGAPAPACWADLIKPEYEGEVQVANPNSSGTAYNLVATVIQIMGEEPAFEWLKALDKNVNQYTKSGAAPAQALARGETMIGISFLHDVVTPIITSDAPVVAVTPCEGTGFEIGSMSIIKGAKNLENAQKFYDWALTADAQKLAAQANSYQLPSNKDAPLPEKAPDVNAIKLIDYDFAKFGSSAERTRLLKRWDDEIGAN